MSVGKMQKENNLVKTLTSSETMGSVTTICSDKTGTLTQNKMTAVRAYINDNDFEASRQILGSKVVNTLSKEHVHLIAHGICCNRAEAEIDWVGKGWKQTGNKTDCALLSFAYELGMNYREVERDIVKVYPFSSMRKRAGIVVRLEKGWRLYVKGAPEMLFKLCKFNMLDGAFDEAKALATVTTYATKALRPIALAYRDFATAPDWDAKVSSSQANAMRQPLDTYAVESDLVFAAIIGIEDPLRPTVKAAIANCRTAGVDVRMVTGDNVETATAIAKQCGILRGDIDYHVVNDQATHEFVIMEGPDFRAKVLCPETGGIIQKEFDLVWPRLRVLGRSSPLDKHVLVTGISQSTLYDTAIGRSFNLFPDRQVTAVTGDGTNDAPALLAADVGFAMKTGTSVCKNAADIILMDDNFASIVSAIKFGRNVYDCISKFVQFQLTVNVVAVIFSIIASLVENSAVFSVVQMLWINVIMDTLGALALASEPPSDTVLERPPYGRSRALLCRYMLINILGQSFYQLSVLFIILFNGGVFGVAPRTQKDEISEHFSFLYNTFLLMTLFNWINMRNLYHEFNMFRGIQRSYMFVSIWVGCLVTQVVLMECGRWVPGTEKNLNIPFKVVALPITLWGWSLLFAALSWVWQIGIVSVCINVNLTRPKNSKPGRKLTPPTIQLTPSTSNLGIFNCEGNKQKSFFSSASMESAASPSSFRRNKRRTLTDTSMIERRSLKGYHRAATLAF